METVRDWVYLIERTFPNLHGAGSVFLGALFVMSLFLAMYLITRKRTHLLVSATIALYLMPFVR